MPELTIGLPVYNGASLLSRSISNLLAQTHRDFALIINDNASTDGTAGLCARFVEEDPRVHYFRNPKTVCWNENFRITLARAKTPYFMWATHDDIWFPSFAEKNITLLAAHPAAVCSVSKIVYFTRSGERYLAPDTGPLTGTPSDRIRRLLSTMHNCGRLYGLYRTEALKACLPSDLHLFGADWLIVALTLLHGDHVEVDEVLLEREAQPPGYYFESFGRIDGFDPIWVDRLLPLHRFNIELRERLPGHVWRDILPALAYLNFRHIALMIEHRVPLLKRLSKPLRNLAADLFHRRWRRSEL
jgi:glycosyltransferase involved in cell wall biosynthesis